MVFVIKPGYDPSDAYFKKSSFDFIMSAGLPKFTRIRGYMGATSHEAIFFRGSEGKNIPLGVFGHVAHLAGQHFQMKPFAIWR